MKKLLILTLISFSTAMLYAQTPETEIEEVEKIEKIEKKITIDDSDQDTTKINLGNYKIVVIENEDGVGVKINEDVEINQDNNTITIKRKNTEESHEIEIEEEQEHHKIDEDEFSDKHENHHRYYNHDDDDDDDNDNDDDDDNSFKARTNWGGLSYGFLQLLSDDVNKTGSTDFLELESGSSWAWEFMSLAVPLGTPYVSLSTGLGVRWDKYQLADKYRLNSNEEFVTGVLTDNSYDENELRSTALEIPLLLNISTSSRKKSNLRFSVGYIQRIGLRSKICYEYSDNGQDHEETIRGDYNLKKFNGFATARIGYRGLTFYGNYGLESIFDKNKGPVLNPLTIGISMRLIPVIRWSKS